MPKGPRGERRPADINKSAFQIVRIATGEESERLPAAKGRPGGLAGGKARSAKLDAETRSEIARRAAKARWKKRGTD